MTYKRETYAKDLFGKHWSTCKKNLCSVAQRFSRRTWHQSNEDAYKNNGRVRDESVNIQLGPLMNIQIHSYQSKEIKDRTYKETDTGGLEHFDIDIFRNSELIGGKPFERIKLKDIVKNKIKNFQGFNEYAREKGILHFLNNDSEDGELYHHQLPIELLYHYCVSLKEHYEKKSKSHTLTIHHLL